VANKTFHKKNQEKLKIYLAKIEKNANTKPISKEDTGHRGSAQTDKNDLQRQRI
jgi:hypothetical protein